MPKNILLADESPTIRKIVELTFSDSEIRVYSAVNGPEAVDRLDAVDPDLVIADIGLSSPSGYEICRKIKRSSRPVPVLLLAGTFEPVDPDLVLECGADGHLVKPFESQILRERVHTLLTGVTSSPAREIEETAAGSATAKAALPADGSPAPEPAPEDREEADAPAAPAPESPASGTPGRPVADGVSEELVEAVSRKVVERLSADVVREIARDVVPELAARIIRERIRELENEEP